MNIERWSIVPVMWDEVASLKIHHIKLREIRIIELARVFTYDEEAFQNIFDFKLSDRDIIEVIKGINRYLK
jgi:glycerol-3-phosphate responsive antiterminator